MPIAAVALGLGLGSSALSAYSASRPDSSPPSESTSAQAGPVRVKVSTYIIAVLMLSKLKERWTLDVARAHQGLAEQSVDGDLKGFLIISFVEKVMAQTKPAGSKDWDRETWLRYLTTAKPGPDFSEGMVYTLQKISKGTKREQYLSVIELVMPRRK